jgi:DNA-binding FadR family transcriptional regulator
MNREAARVMGFHPAPRKGVVLVNATMPCREQRITAVHERVEERLMRSGWSYWDAHREALRAERGEKVRFRPEHARVAVMPYTELVREHKKLVRALRTRDPKLLRSEVREQGKELKEYEREAGRG